MYLCNVNDYTYKNNIMILKKELSFVVELIMPKLLKLSCILFSTCLNIKM